VQCHFYETVILHEWGWPKRLSCLTYDYRGMRIARPNELQTYALPVLTARITESELSKWFPVAFHHITDPQEAAEPSKAAVIRLDAGDYFVLYFGEISKQLTLRIPTASDASRFLTSFLREVPLPRRRILWRREDARLPRTVAANEVNVAASGRRRKTAPAEGASRVAKKK
jgi:hypothetical protein